MRWSDDGPMQPEMAAALAAVDATLAGEPADPEYAELAELALILRRDRPAPSDPFPAAMDEKVQRRFARPAHARGAGRRRWLYAPGAAAAAVAAGVAVVIVIGGNGSGSGAPPRPAVPTATAAASSTAPESGAASAGNGLPSRASQHRATAPPVPASVAASSVRSSSAASSVAASAGAPSQASSAITVPSGSAPAPAPVPSGNRQIVQAAQLQLSAAPSRIDDVAQQVFDVIGAEKGIVNSSNVTAGGNAYGNASFQLSVPSANLGATLTTLSRLRGARVVSRTDATSDITGQVGGAGMRLAEARALRRSLLRQLADATTTDQVNSIKLQLRDADASIASDLSALHELQNKVAYSSIALTIQAAAPVAPAKGSSFTLGRAAHDAGRVLVVVAGVALITLAVMVPVGLVAALAAWIGMAIRRRRRDQALDLV